MQNIISNWNGTILLDGQEVTSTEFQKAFNKISKPFQIVLLPNRVKQDQPVEEKQNKVHGVSGTYKITVKPYMTKPATPEFDFMANWNNNIPMPLMTMVGDKIKETNGMVYMELHGDITSTITQTCLRCGKPITNAVSRYFGMGPVCGGHSYTNPFSTEEELKSAVGEYRKKLQEIKWSGWIIKKAIVEEVEL